MTSRRVALLAVVVVGFACKREAPPPEPPRPPREPVAEVRAAELAPSAAVVGSAVTGAAASAPNEASGLPGPSLAPGKDLAWQIEQQGRVVPSRQHVVELARGPFTLALHVRRGAADRVLVNASFRSTTFDGARLGWPFRAFAGFKNSTRFDGFYEGTPILNNRRRDIFVDEDGPNAWLVCAPGGAPCDGFDAPCAPTDVGVVCRRTIESMQISVRTRSPSELRMERRDIVSSRETELYLVFVLPGHWTEDERAGKAQMGNELAREWSLVRWPKGS